MDVLTVVVVELVVGMNALWPELAEDRPFEVVLTAPREDGGEPLVPRHCRPRCSAAGRRIGSRCQRRCWRHGHQRLSQWSNRWCRNWLKPLERS